ncbi:hypothetical protein [Thermoanaerobacterium butyriciformans]|uniref:Uncharacterized protein n=1 Tax=Thermoanaerobacterium butyriciformans TaxID=1702242 RepID=A0ABS4NGK4_9THEO|nr:hypothetical protein [Thermoanaerobacterium butyriciformans]MBP2072793.1 hypothetical protein [Thermoanaerobacterium butyriciformans]
MISFIKDLINIFIYILISFLLFIQYIWYAVVAGSHSTYMTVQEFGVFIFLSILVCLSVYLNNIFAKRILMNFIMIYFLFAEESVLSILWIVSILDSFRYKNEVLTTIAGFIGLVSMLILFSLGIKYIFRYTSK